MIKFRKLKADEIDVKVGNVTKKGYTLLLYKDARVDMNILDETLGCENWQNKYYEVCGNLFCSLGINTNAGNDKEPYWVWKDDCGVESQWGDKEKGQASDARKRAGVCAGIGRELYTSPFIFIMTETTYNEGKRCYELDDDEKYRKFEVQEIGYDDKGNIDTLTIVDIKSGEVVFKKAPKTRETKKVEKQPKTYIKPVKPSEYVLETGAYKGKTLEEVNKIKPEYLDLCLNSHIPNDIKAIIKQFKEGK